jgi:hypothetical protein
MSNEEKIEDALKRMENKLEAQMHNFERQTELLDRQEQKLSQLLEGSNTDQHKQSKVPYAHNGFIPPGQTTSNKQQSLRRYLAKLERENHQLRRENSDLPNGNTKVINPYALEAGDIILVRPKNPSALTGMNRLKYDQTLETQEKLLGENQTEHTNFTHVAISRRGHEIYESVPFDGVQYTSYWKYMDQEKYDLKVRRLKFYEKEDRAQPVYNVAELIGEGYGFADLALIRAKAERIEWLAKALSWAGKDEDYICSALFASACQREFIDLMLGDSESDVSTITPAHLSLSNAFETINLDNEWVSLE